MNAAARALLEGLIDYAGLFPPAGLGMGQAVANYAAYQRRPDAWALARFVAPVARLGEFEAAFLALPETERLGTRWPLTLLLGPDPSADVGAVAAFQERHVHAGPQVLSLEARAATPEQITALGAVVPEDFELYLELPLAAALPPLVAATAEAGARAKMRTGGVQPGDIPAAAAVHRFLEVCAAARLPFKATAGLHHPVRAARGLTYDPAGPSGIMHGYLNVFLAAALCWRGAGPLAAQVLEVTGARAFRVESEAIAWRGGCISAAELRQARHDFAIAIGSCSFTEPVDEMAELATLRGG